jgi:hypothetical protein
MRPTRLVPASSAAEMEKTPPVKIQPPPFQRRIEPDEIVAVGAVRRVEEFGEDQKCEKGQKQNHAEGGAGGGSEQMPLARIAPVPQRPGTDERRLERKHPGVGRKGEAAP